MKDKSSAGRHEKRLADALHESRTCFTDDAARRITSAYATHGIYPVVSNILEAAQSEYQRPPKSFEDFATQTGRLFCSKFLEHFKKKCIAFDQLCGHPIVDAFLGQHTCEQWAEIIAEQCIKSKLPAISVLGMTHHVEPSMPQVDDDFDDNWMFQFDGASDDPRDTYAYQQRSASPDLPPLAQIHLKGATIIDAWRSSSQVATITAFERSPLSGWTPSKSGGAPVFHGTSAHLKGPQALLDIDTALGSHPTSIARSPGPSQLFPLNAETSGIFTSFSAMRSFLWSVFHAEVISDPPGPTPSGHLNKPFRMRGNQYQGVILISFDSSQPAPAGLSSYMIPIGKESDWSSKAIDYSRRFRTTNFWVEAVRHIHGQSTEAFPDIVHGKDLPSLITSMQRFPCNKNLLWQTAWMSKQAADSLNQKAANIYAISFELPAPPVQPGKGDNKKKTDISTRFRDAKHSLKKALSKKDIRGGSGFTK